MYPANKFVEDFVGADRALKRLALQRVRDIDLWTAATVRIGEPVAEARKKLEDADIDYLLAVDDGNKPHGLAERARRWRRAHDRGLPLQDRAAWSKSTTSCATRSPTCSRARRATAPSWTRRAAWPGCSRSS